MSCHYVLSRVPIRVFNADPPTAEKINDFRGRRSTVGMLSSQDSFPDVGYRSPGDAADLSCPSPVPPTEYAKAAREAFSQIGGTQGSGVSALTKELLKCSYQGMARVPDPDSGALDLAATPATCERDAKEPPKFMRIDLKIYPTSVAVSRAI